MLGSNHLIFLRKKRGGRGFLVLDIFSAKYVRLIIFLFKIDGVVEIV
jgi:hypothetical protein